MGGWGPKKGSVLKSLHYFKEPNSLSICGMAQGPDNLSETADEYWKCDVCKRLYRDGER